jgi:hypothetical protein
VPHAPRRFSGRCPAPLLQRHGVGNVDGVWVVAVRAADQQLHPAVAGAHADPVKDHGGLRIRVAVPAGQSEPARAEACRRVGKDAHAVAAVARDLGVGFATIMRAVGDHGRPLVDDSRRLDGVATLGLDETASSRPPGSHPLDG